jgi:hypothetical protein
MSSPAINLGNHGFMIVVELDLDRSPLNHLLERFLARPALSMLVVTPWIYFSVLHKSQRVSGATCHLLNHQHLLSDGRSFLNEALYQNGRALLLSVRVFYTQLALRIGAHSIDQLLASYEYRMGSPTGDLNDWDVVRAESGYHMDLSLSRYLLAESKLSKPIGSPWKDLCEIRFISVDN